MTWSVMQMSQAAAVLAPNIALVRSDQWLDGGTNAYDGDKQCTTLFPLACLGFIGTPQYCLLDAAANSIRCSCNADAPATVFEVKYTVPVPGYWLSSYEHANALCACLTGHDSFRML